MNTPTTITRAQAVEMLLTDDALSKQAFLHLYVQLYLSIDQWSSLPDSQFKALFREAIKKNEEQRQRQLDQQAEQARIREAQNQLHNNLLDSVKSSSPYSSGASDSAMLSSTPWRK